MKKITGIEFVALLEKKMPLKNYEVTCFVNNHNVETIRFKEKGKERAFVIFLGYSCGFNVITEVTGHADGLLVCMIFNTILDLE